MNTVLYAVFVVGTTAAIVIAFVCINMLDRRITELEDRAKNCDARHDLLVEETKIAFAAWLQVRPPSTCRWCNPE